MSYGAFARGPSSSVIPRSVSSASTSGLERKMLDVQRRLKGQCRWQIVVKDNKFYAFYTVDIDEDLQSLANQKVGR